jgi:hypothetical protein
MAQTIRLGRRARTLSSRIAISRPRSTFAPLAGRSRDRGDGALPGSTRTLTMRAQMPLTSSRRGRSPRR